MTCSVCGLDSQEKICSHCGCHIGSVRVLRFIAGATLVPMLAMVVAIPTLAVPKYLSEAERIERALEAGQKTVKADLAIFFEQISAPNKPNKFVRLAEQYEKKLRPVLEMRGLGANHPRARQAAERFSELLDAIQELYLAVKNDVRKGDGTTSGLSVLRERAEVLGVPKLVPENYESIILQLRDLVQEVANAQSRLEHLEESHARLYSTMQLLISKAAVAADAKEPSMSQLEAIRDVAVQFDSIWESTSVPEVERAAELGRDWAVACAEYYDVYGRINAYLRSVYNPDYAAVRELRARYLRPLSHAADAFRDQLKAIESRIRDLRTQSQRNPRDEVITPSSVDEV